MDPILKSFQNGKNNGIEFIGCYSLNSQKDEHYDDFLSYLHALRNLIDYLILALRYSHKN